MQNLENLVHPNSKIPNHNDSHFPSFSASLENNIETIYPGEQVLVNGSLSPNNSPLETEKHFIPNIPYPTTTHHFLESINENRYDLANF